MESPLLDQTPEDDLWEDYGIFKRNKLTGEMVLKTMAGGALGTDTTDSYSIDYSSPLASPVIASDEGVWDKLKKYSFGPTVQGASWIPRLGLTAAKVFNRLAGDEEDVKFYSDAEEEFDKNISNYTWGNNDSGGSAPEELKKDFMDFAASVQKDGFLGADYGRAAEAAAGLVATAEYLTTDTLSSAGIGKAISMPVKGGMLLSKGTSALSKIPFIKPVMKSVSSMEQLGKAHPFINHLGSSAAIGFGMREFIDKEDVYTQQGLSQWVALPSALGSAATQAFLEYLGSRYMGRLASPEIAKALYKDVKPSFWRDILEESSTELAQGFLGKAFEETPLAILGDGDIHIGEWLEQGVQDALLAPLGVAGFHALGKARNGVKTLAGNATRIDTMLSPSFAVPATSLQQLKSEKPGDYRKAMEAMWETKLLLGGTSGKETDPTRWHLAHAYAWAKKFQHISEVQEIYSRILDRYKQHALAPEEAEMEQNALAEGGGLTNQDIFTGDNLEEILSDRSLRMMQAFVGDTQDPSRVPQHANDVISVMGQLLDINGALTPNGVDAINSAAEVFFSDVAYPQITRTQKDLFLRRATDLLANGLTSKEERDAAVKDITRKQEEVEERIRSRFLLPGNSDKAQRAWDRYMDVVRSLYASKGVQDNYASIELASKQHIAELNAIGIGYVASKNTSEALKKAMEDIQGELSIKAASAQGFQKEDLWKIRLYSHFASFLDGQDSRIPSIPENIIDRTQVESLVDNISKIAYNARMDFEENLALAKDLDALAGSILGDKDSPAVTELAETFRDPAIAALGTLPIRERVNQFLSTIMSPQDVQGYNARLDVALSALGGAVITTPALEGPFKEISSLFRQHGLTEKDAYEYITGKTPIQDEEVLAAVTNLPLYANVRQPIRFRIDEDTLVKEQRIHEHNTVGAAISQINMGMLAKGQAPLASRLSAMYSKATPSTKNRTALEHAAYWASLIENSGYVQQFDDKATRQTIAYRLLNTLFKSSSLTAIETINQMELEYGRPLSADEIVGVGGEIRDIGSALIQLVKGEFLRGMEQPVVDLDAFIHRAKVAMILAGGVSKRYLRYKDKTMDTFTESSILFTKFATMSPKEIMPYLQSAFRDISAESRTGTGINKYNAQVVRDSFSLLLDKLYPEKKTLSAEDIETNEEDIGYQRNLIDEAQSAAKGELEIGTVASVTGLGPSDPLEKLYRAAFQKAKATKNVLLTAAGRARTNKLSRAEILNAAEEIIAERSATQEAAQDNGTVATPDAVMHLLSLGYADFLHGDTDLSPQEGPRAFSDSDNLRITEKKLADLQKYIDSHFQDPEGEEAQEFYIKAALRIGKEHLKASEETKFLTDRSGNPLPPVDPLLLRRSAELYQRATAKYHSERGRVAVSSSPNMTHKVGKPQASITDPTWDNNILSMLSMAIAQDVPIDVSNLRVSYKGNPMSLGQAIAGFYENGKITKRAFTSIRAATAYFAMPHLKNTPFKADVSPLVTETDAIDILTDIRSKVFVQRIINHVEKTGDELGKELVIALTFPGVYDTKRAGRLEGEFKNWVELNRAEVSQSNVKTAAERFSKNSTDVISKMLKSIRFASNPDNIGTLLGTESKLKELVQIAQNWNSEMMDQVRVARDYYLATKRAGVQRWGTIGGKDIGVLLDEAAGVPFFDQMSDDAKNAFYYTRKFVNATQNALTEGNTPGALIAKMTKAGMSIEEQVMELGLLDAFLSKHAAANKDSAYAALSKAIGSIAVEDKLADSEGRPVLAMQGLVGVPKKLGTSRILLSKDLGRGRKGSLSGGVLFHEFIHGVISSGTFSQYIGEGATKKIEDFLGMSLEGAKTSTAAQEKIQSLITTVLIGNSIPGLDASTNEAIQRFRNGLLTGISSHYYANDVSDYPVLGQDTEINSELSQIIVGAMSLNPEDSEKLFALGGDGRITLGSLALQGKGISISNINLVPLLAGGSKLVEDVISRPDLFKAYAMADKILQADVSHATKKAMLEDVNSADSLSKFFSEHLGISIDASEFDSNTVSILRDWAEATTFGLSDKYLTVKGSIKASDRRAAKSKDATSMSYRRDVVQEEMANAVINVAGIPGAMGPILQDMQNILQAHAEIPLATDHKKHPTKNKALIASFRKLTLVDKALRLIGPTTTQAENLMKSLGLTKEYLITHQINGIQEFARKSIFDKVRDFRGSKWAGNLVEINESLADIFDDIDAEGIASDVWAWLGANRQLEIERGSRLGEFLENPSMQKPIDATSSAAARIVLTAMKMKHGSNGGRVAEYAKRLVRWQNATVLEPQLRIGMISKKEYDAAIRSSDWYIPLIKAQERLANNPYAQKLFTDGTNSALKSLRSDSTGSEHPLQEMVSKAVYIKFLTTVQEARQNMIWAVADVAGGIDKARQYGLEPLVADEEAYAEWEEVVNPADIRTALEYEKRHDVPPKGIKIERVKGGGERIMRAMLGLPMSKRGANQWIKDHARTLGADKKTGLNRNVHTIWKDGTPTYILFHDGELLDAIDGIHPTDLAGPVNNIIYKFFSKMAYMKSSLIVRNPGFFFGMFTKDIPTAFARSTFGIKNPGDVLSSLLESTAAIFPSLAKEFPHTFKDFTERDKGLATQTSMLSSLVGKRMDEALTSDRASKMQKDIAHYKYRPRGGVKTTPRVLNAIKSDIRKWHERYIANKYATSENYNSIVKNLTRGYSKTLGTGINTIWNILGGASTAFDVTPRLAERKVANKLRNEGIPVQDLFIDYVDRNLTLDFSRKSPQLAFLNSVYAFAAPGFQDFAQFIKNIRDPRTAGVYAMRSILAFSVPAIINYIRWHDDDEWQELDYWQKFNFFYFGKRTGPNGEKQGFYRIPWGIGIPAFIFKDPIIATLQYASGRDPDAFKDLMHNGWQQSPLSMAALPSDKLSPLEALGATISPSATDPIYDLMINRDAQFTQNPIDASVGVKGLGSPEERGLKRAGILDVAAANLPPLSALNMTPRQASYLITRTFPGIGATTYTFANNLFTKGYRDLDSDTEIGFAYRTPIRLQPWSVSPAYGEKSQSVQRFYTTNLRINERKNDYGTYLKRDPDAAMNVLRKYPELSKGVPGIFKEAETYIKDMRAKREEWIDTQLKLGYDEEDVYAAAVPRFDIPITIRAGAAMEYYYQVKGRHVKHRE